MLLYRSNFVVAESHLDLGLQFLAKGQIAEALNQFHSAIDEDPTQFMPYYRRATAYLAMGKGKAALADLNKVIEFRPDFQAARSQRANIFLKLGDLDQASADLDFIIVQNKNGENTEFLDKLAVIKELSALSTEVEALYEHDRDYRACIPLLDRLIDSCPWNVLYREQRASCFSFIGEPAKSIFDLKQLTILINDNTDGFLKISLLYYQLGDDEQSLSEIRECLKLDPDQKDCFSHYKKSEKIE
jgi:DnaJ family protein C protein 3